MGLPKATNIGFIGKPHGLRGAFFIGGRRSLLPAQYREVTLGDKPGLGPTYQIRSNQIMNDRSVLSLEGIDDRTALEQLAGAMLWSVYAPEAGDALSPRELIGLPVVDSLQVTIGVLSDAYNHGGVDNLEVQSATDPSLYLEIPFVAEYVNLQGLTSASKCITLTVSSEVFAEFWSSI